MNWILNGTRPTPQKWQMQQSGQGDQSTLETQPHGHRKKPCLVWQNTFSKQIAFSHVVVLKIFDQRSFNTHFVEYLPCYLQNWYFSQLHRIRFNATNLAFTTQSTCSWHDPIPIHDAQFRKPLVGNLFSFQPTRNGPKYWKTPHFHAKPAAHLIDIQTGEEFIPRPAASAAHAYTKTPTRRKPTYSTIN